MPTRNVNLSDQQAKFIQQSIRKGHYRNASEVVRAALRLLQRQDQEDKLKIELLRRLAEDSFGQIDNGEFEVVSPAGLERFMEKVDGRVQASKPR